MRADVQARLAALNREFYEAHGEAFGETRPRLAAGVKRLLARIAPGARVLEAGCGDGKVGRWLAARGARYVGLDASDALLERARRLSGEWRVDSGQQAVSPPSTDRCPLTFLKADLLAPNWDAPLGERLFDWALAFAVFHHLPGAETRARVLRTLAARLAPEGRLAMSNWQLTRSERLRRRIAPWDLAGLTDADVEPGDYLLTWERGAGRGLRYVHVLDEAEARRLADAAGLRVAEVFHSDGRTGDLSDYVVLQRP